MNDKVAIEEGTTCKIENLANSGINTIKQSIEDKIKLVKDKIQQEYNINIDDNDKQAQQSYAKRPDINYLIVIFIIFSLLVCLYLVWPYLGASNSYIFSEADYFKSLKNPSSAFHLKDLGKSQLIIDSLQRYFAYFKLEPYSLQAQGLDDIARGVIFLPILSFLIIYIVPPIVISYIAWFVYKYFSYVTNGLWGWFLMLYDYGTTLIEGTLAQKWYIRWVTGWSRSSPDFGTYFDNWKRQYVDGPIYAEKVKYVEKYYLAKEKYFSKPYFEYITKPTQKLKVNAYFAEQTFFSRFMENLIIKMEILKHNIIDVPKKYIYKGILETNQKTNDILGITNVTGTCNCPTKTNNANNANNAKDAKDANNTKEAKEHLKTCNQVDKTLNIIVKYSIIILGMTFIIMLSLYLFNSILFFNIFGKIGRGITALRYNLLPGIIMQQVS